MEGRRRVKGSYKYDVFVCYASEDKDSFIRPLAQKLKEESLNVWYDEFALRVGDSLRRKIDQGLLKSQYGIVVLSPNFFEKEWPQKELHGLTAREIEGVKVILPVWHNVGREEVMSYSPILADRVGVSTSGGLEYVVSELLKVLRPENGDETNKDEQRLSESIERSMKEIKKNKLSGSDKYVIIVMEVIIIAFFLLSVAMDIIINLRKHGILGGFPASATVTRGEQSMNAIYWLFGIATSIYASAVLFAEATKKYKVVLLIGNFILLFYLFFFSSWFRNSIFFPLWTRIITD